ncbi:hypothetical protein PACTADRAFT_52089 [Pachysolen tannophilus NRRL Y-2460]|uniref:BHLH domain-containing protein n=1 Tax=Pachysolen tannophilus NRRL Y-2460 TaxID=669874 RepID=A0A1E4TPB6_PACTA|nr:hypothetical protein PACTADRAFT_52089 [Pachysolen tannophilus NRRL Y-2460]
MNSDSDSRNTASFNLFASKNGNGQNQNLEEFFNEFNNNNSNNNNNNNNNTDNSQAAAVAAAAAAAGSGSLKFNSQGANDMDPTSSTSNDASNWNLFTNLNDHDLNMLEEHLQLLTNNSKDHGDNGSAGPENSLPGADGVNVHGNNHDDTNAHTNVNANNEINNEINNQNSNSNNHNHNHNPNHSNNNNNNNKSDSGIGEELHSDFKRFLGNETSNVDLHLDDGASTKVPDYNRDYNHFPSSAFPPSIDTNEITHSSSHQHHHHHHHSDHDHDSLHGEATQVLRNSIDQGSDPQSAGVKPELLFTPLLSPAVTPMYGHHGQYHSNGNSGGAYTNSNGGFSPLTSPALEFQNSKSPIIRVKRNSVTNYNKSGTANNCNNNGSSGNINEEGRRKSLNGKSKTPGSTPISAPTIAGRVAKNSPGIKPSISRRNSSTASKVLNEMKLPESSIDFKTPLSKANKKISSSSNNNNNNMKQEIEYNDENEGPNNHAVTPATLMNFKVNPTGNHQNSHRHFSQYDQSNISGQQYQQQQQQQHQHQHQHQQQQQQQQQHQHQHQQQQLMNTGVILNTNRSHSNSSSPVILPSSTTPIMMPMLRKTSSGASSNSTITTANQSSSKRSRRDSSAKNTPNLGPTDRSSSVTNFSPMLNGTADQSDKKINHKLAEQGRRNRMNMAIQNLEKLIPNEWKKDILVPSKATTIEVAIEYIKSLQNRLDSSNEFSNTSGSSNASISPL